MNANERELFNHVLRWGSDGYPIIKRGSRWYWHEARGVLGSPVAYRTKREATAAFETWLELMLVRARGQA